MSHAELTYVERMHHNRQEAEWRRERMKRNVITAIQTLGFAICVSTYIGVTLTALGSAYVKSPSSKFTSSAHASAKAR